MRYQVLATDYDGTLAHHGSVSESTIQALEGFLATGRRLVMVTGRELPELQEVFPRLDLFEWVVAENGALLYRPATKEERPLADPPPEKFIQALEAKGVAPMSVGRVIIATWEPHQTTVLETIHELGLEWQVIFNKGAVMVLPAGVNKATGLTAALQEMGLSPHNVVGIGDAENDHAFLKFCEFSTAVSNALPAVKETADFVASQDHGNGVSQLVEEIIGSDLAEYDDKLRRHHLAIGKSDDEEVCIPSYGPCVLICGPSGSGKSTLVTRLVEAVHEQKYQFCLFDPEGDYENFVGAVTLGRPDDSPSNEEVMQLLASPDANAIVNMTGLAIPDRPPFFLDLLGPVLQMRTRTGRPHWLILDEAHHLMPADWEPPENILPEEIASVALITVHPELLSPEMLKRVDTLMIVGAKAEETLATFCEAASMETPELDPPELESGELILWSIGGEPPRKVKAYPCKTERRRHRRKYAEGELPPERSFYFRGPEAKMNLRAQNLRLFLQLADGVDDETWLHHLQQGDYSQWFADCVKDDNLAAAAKQVESIEDASAQDSRAMIRAAIERDYVVMPTSSMPVAGAS